MNNKGLASTTIVYSAVILLSIIMATVLKIEYTKYTVQKEYVNEINKELSECLKKGEC